MVVAVDSRKVIMVVAVDSRKGIMVVAVGFLHRIYEFIEVDRRFLTPF